jgi:hypothetical protein
MQMRLLFRRAGLAVVHRFGMKIYDCANGRLLGRALLVPWKGQIHVIGLEATVRPLFLPQKRLTFWKQNLGFTPPSAPDFPSLYHEAEACAKEPDSLQEP